MQNIVEDVLEVVELKLEMAEVALYALCELYFTQEGMKYPCSIAYGRHKASNLIKDGQVSNRIEQIELLERICVLLNHQDLLLAIQLQPHII